MPEYVAINFFSILAHFHLLFINNFCLALKVVLLSSEPFCSSGCRYLIFGECLFWWYLSSKGVHRQCRRE